LASDLIELSTRQSFGFWLPVGTILRGWRSASGNTSEGIPSIEQGIRDCRAVGAVFGMAAGALKAEALYFANRTSQALEEINEAETLAERFEQRDCCAEIHRVRGVFLTALGAEETQIEASFSGAISTARQQKSVSLEKHGEATYAEYRRQKASGSGGRGFRLPLLVVYLRPPFRSTLVVAWLLPDQGDRIELSRRQPDHNRLPCDSPLTTLLFLCKVSFFDPHPTTSEGIQFELEK
jgi:hypothetical protein